jgi:hypothetical protein
MQMPFEFSDAELRRLDEILLSFLERNGESVPDTHQMRGCTERNISGTGEVIQGTSNDLAPAETGLKANGEPDLSTIKGRERAAAANEKTLAVDTTAVTDLPKDHRAANLEPRHGDVNISGRGGVGRAQGGTTEPRILWEKCVTATEANKTRAALRSWLSRRCDEADVTDTVSALVDWTIGGKRVTGKLLSDLIARHSRTESADMLTRMGVGEAQTARIIDGLHTSIAATPPSGSALAVAADGNTSCAGEFGVVGSTRAGAGDPELVETARIIEGLGSAESGEGCLLEEGAAAAAAGVPAIGRKRGAGSIDGSVPKRRKCEHGR